MPNGLIAVDPADSVLAPHPTLSSYYKKPAAKGGFLRDIFDATAADYDKLERVLGLGSGSWHRRASLCRAGLEADMMVVDVATGTGLVAREALSIVGPRGRVIGVDPSIGMLSRARFAKRFDGVLGRGEALPLANASADFLCMGYALRHLSDLRVAFSEFRRVLRPGGKFCLLEISRPAGSISRRALDAYFRLCLPVISRLVATNPQTHRLWEYYWETIDQCVAPQFVVEVLRQVGFANVQRRVSLGIFSEYVGRCP